MNKPVTDHGTDPKNHKLRTLAPTYYFGQEILDKEHENIFRKEWICVGRETDWPEAGDYFAKDLPHQPVVIWRGKDNVLRAFENVCRHRMATIAKDSGNAGTLSCPYHRWTYDSGGELRGAPGVSTELDDEKICLPQLQLEIWQGFVFVNADPEATPLAPRLKGLDDILNVYELGDFTWSDRSAGSFGRRTKANWKIIIENSLEGYHIPFVHEESLAPFVSRRQSPPATDAWSLSYEPRTTPLPATDQDPTGMNEQDRTNAYTFGIYPCTIINVDCDTLIWFSVLPEGPETSYQGGGIAKRVLNDLRTIGGTNALTEDEYVAWGQTVAQEDQDICESIQRGVRARHAKGGPLIDEQEGNLAPFHNYIRNKVDTTE